MPSARRHSWALRIICGIGVLCLWTIPSIAEVSIDLNGAANQLILLGDVEGPDPWPDFTPIRETPATWQVNPQGSAVGDRDPDMAAKPGVPPAVVYAAVDGSDLEI